MAETETILEIRNLKKSFGKDEVLKDVSLKVNKGEVIVVLGPSGCGKSTLLRCLNGLEEIQSGNILLDGVDIAEKGTDWNNIRQKIGMVFQNYELFLHKTVLQNIILAPIKVQKRNRKEVELEAEKLLERVGLLDKKNVYPRQLSGGQKQRAAIVRALIMKPEILLFDEVTAAIDPEMTREVLDVMLELARNGSTMIIVTHEMKFAEAVADKIMFLDDGENVETATPKEFFNQPRTERARRFLNTFTLKEVI